jgi:hypothetical protein
MERVLLSNCAGAVAWNQQRKEETVGVQLSRQRKTRSTFRRANSSRSAADEFMANRALKTNCIEWPDGFHIAVVASQVFYDCWMSPILVASMPCRWIAALVCKLRPFSAPRSERGMSMESVHDDCFIVFLRHDRAGSNRPDCSERPLTKCSSYEEARRIQRELHHTSRVCVIRYVGPTGGGD